MARPEPQVDLILKEQITPVLLNTELTPEQRSKQLARIAAKWLAENEPVFEYIEDLFEIWNITMHEIVVENCYVKVH